ncbi:sulfate ABC transporter permease [Gluconobacter morbifer]|uniref:Sulfate transport system permease protein CysW n=1 Tax=Gluconobacter morbifer G707 TaxID=1088869 RepID=G6XHG6_9PROT|nr:sulfate ABC transporter permease subunit [Gluconobacter morbifer]EHH69624.1 sulfate transport system permease protein CysW [Gluconobacter morbifer G707]
MIQPSARIGRFVLIVLSYVAVATVLLLPVLLILSEALQQGWHHAWTSLMDPDALSAIRLTAFVTVIVTVLNTVGGMAAAWFLTKYTFPGRRFMVALIELPLSISPVIAGLVWLLLFGREGWWGNWLERHDIQVAFAVPGIVLATLFVTFPYVARTLMPYMEQQGTDAEEAAFLLGASFWKTLRHVTLPDAGGALLSGILLTTARAMGEFGAVSVVSGHIPGETETMPLHIETLYNGYQTAAAFTMAALLALFAMAIVLFRSVLEHSVAKKQS